MPGQFFFGGVFEIRKNAIMKILSSYFKILTYILISFRIQWYQRAWFACYVLISAQCEIWKSTQISFQ